MWYSWQTSDPRGRAVAQWARMKRKDAPSQFSGEKTKTNFAAVIYKCDPASRNHQKVARHGFLVTGRF